MLNKQKFALLLRCTVSFGLLLALIWIMRHDIGKIKHILKNANKIYILIAVGIHIPLTLLLAYRLKLLLLGQKIILHMKDLMYLTFIGFLFNNFLPTAIGGDIVKAHYASKKTNNRVAVYAAILSDRIFGCLSTLFIAIVGLIFIGGRLNNNAIIFAILFLFFMLIGAVIFLFTKKVVSNPALSNTEHISLWDKIKEKVNKLFNSINSYKNQPALLVKIILISLVMQSFTIVGIYFFILSLGATIHILKLFLIIPLIWAISMFPSLNGLGVREGAFVYFLTPDLGKEAAFALSLLWLGVMFLYSIIGAVLHLMHHAKAKQW